MSFAYPWLLLLLLPFALLVIRIWRRPLPSIRIPSLRPFVSGNARRPLASRLPLILYSLAIAIVILALARPRYGSEKVLIRAEGIDIMLALDLSGSMQSIDVPGKISTENELRQAITSGAVKNRLEIAKDEVRNFIEKRPNDRIGLIGFAQLPYSLCPPTLDHAWLIANLDQLKPGIIGDKTGIAGPIASAVKRLKDSNAKRRVLVLFTDGANNVNSAITPLQAAKLAHDYDIVIYTVGIGSDRAFVLQRTFMGEQFVPIEGEFDEDLLKEIAKTSEGRYYKAADAEGLAKVMNEINKLEKTTVEQPRYMEYSEYAPRLIALALTLLLLGFLAEHTVFLRLP